jgi:hypothetical protein
MTYILSARETAASRFWYVGIGCFDIYVLAYDHSPSWNSDDLELLTTPNIFLRIIVAI